MAQDPLQVPPATPPFTYPRDVLTTLWYYTGLRLLGNDPALPGGGRPDAERIREFVQQVSDYPEGPEPAPPGPGQACTDARKQWEYQLMANTYANLVRRNLAAGWVWGPQGNIQITVALATGRPVPLGSCWDWQTAIWQALCALPIHCWQICKIRSVWHKAVVVYPKDALWWRASGLVFDPWFLGAPNVFTVFQWFMWAGLNWKYDCCK